VYGKFDNKKTRVEIMQHLVWIGLLCWGFLSLPLCVMFGRMFSVARDAQPELSIDGDARLAEVFDRFLKNQPSAE